MYLANVMVVVEAGILFQSWYLFVWAAVLLVAFHLFVVGYEEPTPHRLFGDDDETYRGGGPPVDPEAGAASPGTTVMPRPSTAAHMPFCVRLDGLSRVIRCEHSELARRSVHRLPARAPIGFGHALSSQSGSGGGSNKASSAASGS
jgi:hypothetical protein